VFVEFNDSDVVESTKSEPETESLKSTPVRVRVLKNMDSSPTRVYTVGLEYYISGLMRTQILVLDEATAAIDTEMDAMIQTTISEVFANCTMLVIAHRLNTVMNCQRILVLDAGKVRQQHSSYLIISLLSYQFSQLCRSLRDDVLDVHVFWVVM